MNDRGAATGCGTGCTNRKRPSRSITASAALATSSRVIDFARGMIEIADKLAAQAGVGDKCEFVVGAFPADIDPSEGPFDACTGNGFFDYIEHPVPIITAMREMTKGKLIMSFPKAVEWRVPIRRLRFWIKGTPLFLYREAQVRDILDRSGVIDYEMIHLDRDYLVVANV